MKISFFKTGKPKDFTYSPLFYDERKEELNKIRKSVEDQSEADAPERMRIRLERSWRERHDRRRGKAPASNLRLLAYLAALALLIYFLFFAKIF